jgi:hypothetical protein
MDERTETAIPALMRNHLRLWLQAAILRAAGYLRLLGGDELIAERFSFLEIYLREAEAALPEGDGELGERWRAALRLWENGLPAEAAAWPLRRLQRTGLEETPLLALMLAGLVEMDARFGALYAALHPAGDEHRLTVGLLDDLLAGAGWSAARCLAERGLLTIHKPEEPRAARPVSVPGPVWDAITGESAFPLAGPDSHPGEAPTNRHLLPDISFYPPESLDTLEAIHDLMPEALYHRLKRAPQLLEKGLAGGLVVRGMRGAGRLRLCGAAARALNLGVVVVEPRQPQALPELCRLAGPLAVLLGGMPVLRLDLGPGEMVEMPPLPGYQGPVGVILGFEGGVQGGAVDSSITLRIPTATRRIRRAAWGRALGEAQPSLEAISDRFYLTLDGIRRAARLARAYAALDDRLDVLPEDVQEACRTLNRQALGAFATPVELGAVQPAAGAAAQPSPALWDSLVAPLSTRAELNNLLLRCRQRERVLDTLGPGFRGQNRGVRALFSGPSGTGKTLAACILTAELSLDLYRVDLASVVNKYIGETERNLSQLFARAEELDVVLLLDEGDSLMTGRTEVRSSNDRYANLETNYLLQRMESFEGILIVTTNAARRIDEAFQRRMDVHVDFTPPNAAQRYAIWKLHLAHGHQVGEAFLRQASNACALTGGQIRNAALHAALLAVERGELVGEAVLAEAVSREYQKLGAVSPIAAPGNGSA